MKRFTFLLGVAAATLANATPAISQEVIMRRPLIVPTKGAEWRVSPFLIYDIDGNVVQPRNACGPYEERREVDCVVSGKVVGDSYCRDVGPKPEESKQSFIDTGCSYDWFQGQWQDPGPSCSNAEAQQRTVECRRSYDDVKVADALCSGAKPTTERTVVDHSTCTYSWNSSDPFADPGQNCTATEEWTRNVFCERDLDKVPVADGQCDAATKPTSIDVREDYSACSYSWDADETFLDPGASCTANETQTRAVWCKRDLDDNVEEDAKCDAASRPAASQSVEDFSGCTYTATNWTNPANPTCSAANTETQTADCRRSDGTIVSDSVCASNGVSLTRTVSNNADYSGCSYSAVAWTNPANPTCSAANTETQTADCRRSDGTIVGGSNCTSRSIALTRTVTNSADYSGCSYKWITGGWQDPGRSCTPTETQTRSVICRRTQTGQTVSDSYCGSGKPSPTQTVEDFSGCSASSLTVSWGGWSPWSSSCSTSATRTRSGTCKADSQTVASSVCTSRGLPVTDSETSAQYSGCSYTPLYGSWSICQPPGRQSSSMDGCTRNGVNQSVAISYCTDAGHLNPKTQNCTLPAGTGPVLYSDEFGGQTYTPCSYFTDVTITKGQAGFPSKCNNAGGTWFQRDVLFCEPSRDPYGSPYEAELTETCRAY